MNRRKFFGLLGGATVAGMAAPKLIAAAAVAAPEVAPVVEAAPEVLELQPLFWMCATGATGVTGVCGGFGLAGPTGPIGQVGHRRRWRTVRSTPGSYMEYEFRQKKYTQ